jgi:putative Mg2+ transporter-C (MgtC) family protein
MTELDLLWRSLAALAAGAAVGIERGYRGRAAGMRTYALVSFGSSLLVGAAELAHAWAATPGMGDPTRVVQGIVTGIGFLGAGVIIRENFSVRGLTTAASIWVIAGIGVVFGSGLYVLGAAGTLVTWSALDVLGRLETHMPELSLVHCEIELPRRTAWDEHVVHAFVEDCGFAVKETSYKLDRAAQTVTYELVMWSKDARAPSILEQALLARDEVLGFRVRPGRD